MEKPLPIMFIVFATVIMLAACWIENINGRFWLNDFKVYYEASHALPNGGQLYGVVFALGSGYYKYSPFTALLVIPISLLPYKVACIVQYFILAMAVISMLILVFRILNEHLFEGKLKSPNMLLSAVFICFIIHLIRELHLGNINLLLLLLLTLSLQFILQKRFIWAGILLALVIISKPFFVLLLMPLVLRKYVKTILSVSVSLALFVIIPAIVTGFSRNIELHKEWLNTMIDHADAFPSNNTLDALIRNYIFHAAPQNMQYYILFAICATYVIVFYFVTRERNEQTLKKDLILEWFLLIALMPTLFRTDTQHFLLSAPLLLILCYYLFISRNAKAIILFVILVLLYDCNSSDLLGGNLSTRVNDMGLLGISNIFIIAMAAIIYFKNVRNNFKY